MLKTSKLFAGGIAALLFGATGFMSGCDDGSGVDDSDMPPPPAVEDQSPSQNNAPLSTPPADDAADSDGGASDLPALDNSDNPDEGNGEGSGS